jgi:hypothetical protein
VDLRFDLSFSYLLFMRVRMEATRLHNARCTMHDACFHLQFCDVIRRARPHFSPLQDRKTSQPQGRKTHIKGQDTLKLVFLEESEELFILLKTAQVLYSLFGEKVESLVTVSETETRNYTVQESDRLI